MGPVMTDVVALLGRGAFFSAPFRNSISSACLPNARTSAAPPRIHIIRISEVSASRGKAMRAEPIS